MLLFESFMEQLRKTPRIVLWIEDVAMTLMSFSSKYPQKSPRLLT
jgi:hypothetical protein